MVWEWPGLAANFSPRLFRWAGAIWLVKIEFGPAGRDFGRNFVGGGGLGWSPKNLTEKIHQPAEISDMPAEISDLAGRPAGRPAEKNDRKN